MKKPGYSELENRIKQLEEKLKEIELQHLWNVYAQSPIPSFIVSKEGNFVEYNDAMAELTGYTHEEVPDLNAWMPKIYPDEEYRNKVMEISRKSRHREIKVKRDEFVITRKDGKKRYVEFSVFDIMHKGKPVDLQVLQGVDITERKQAEETLRESKENYRELADSIDDVFFAMDKDLRYTYWNKASEKLTGIAAKDAIGKSIFDIFPDNEDTRRAVSVYQEVKKTQQPKNFINEYRLKGKTYFFEISAYPSKNGLSVFVKDITDRKKAEEALKESEAKYRALFESSADGILIADIETKKFLYANPAFYTMLGYSEKEILSKGVSDIHPKDALEHVISEFEAQARGEKTLAPNIPCLRKDGTIIYADINTTKVLIDGRECNIGFFRDITEHKKAEEERLQREKLRGVLEMAGAASHELTQPMQAISGYSEHLLMNMPEDNPLCEELTIIKKQIERMAKITTKLQNI